MSWEKLNRIQIFNIKVIVITIIKKNKNPGENDLIIIIIVARLVVVNWFRVQCAHNIITTTVIIIVCVAAAAGRTHYKCVKLVCVCVCVVNHRRRRSISKNADVDSNVLTSTQTHTSTDVWRISSYGLARVKYQQVDRPPAKTSLPREVGEWHTFDPIARVYYTYRYICSYVCNI